MGRRLVFGVGLVVSLVVVAQMLAPAALAASGPLQLERDTSVLQAWPSITMLSDPQGTLSAAEAQAAPGRFTVPDSAYAALGVRKDVVWLRFPVQMSAQAPANWVLDIDYAVLHRIDLYVYQDGRLVQQAALGNSIPFADRPLRSRSHAIELGLQPGTRYEMLLRVQTRGTMILPITLNSPAEFHARASNEQMLQGLLNGLALCLLLYSLGQWIALREPLFAKYALLISGSLLYSLLHFGIGTQYLWTDRLWVEEHIGGISAFIAICGSFLFIEQALAEPGPKGLFSHVMKGGAVLSALCGLVYALGWIGIDTVTAIVNVLGLAPSLLGISGAFRRVRRGDSVGTYFFLAWAIYFTSTAVMIGLVKGQVDVNFWTMHSFQFGATLDMLVFMRVLGLRTQAIQTAAQHATRERDAMRSLAHSDPLTGLPNRRGLNDILGPAIAQSMQDRILAIYVLDLDGFKPVNDRFGHDVGDELLIAVARRLQANVRASDAVARLGGDEFVVMAGGLHNGQQAHELGTKLLDAFLVPFELSRNQCKVGLTIGYVLAPLDGRDAFELLKRADAAMYAGKQGGKHCLRRLDAVAQV